MQIESKIYIYFTWGLSVTILKELQLFIRLLILPDLNSQRLSLMLHSSFEGINHIIEIKHHKNKLCGLWILLIFAMLPAATFMSIWTTNNAFKQLSNCVIPPQLLRDVWTWRTSWTTRLTLTGRSTTPRYWSRYWTERPSLTSTPTPTTRTPGGATLWLTFRPSTISRSASVVSIYLMNLCGKVFEINVLAFYTISRG